MCQQLRILQRDRVSGIVAAVLTLASSFLVGSCAPESSPESVPEARDAVDSAAPQTQHWALGEAPAWSVTGSMNKARQAFISVRLESGEVLVAGGLQTGAVDTGNVNFNRGEIYDPLLGAFTPIVSKMTKKRVSHTAVLLNTGRVLLIGGFGEAQSATTAELYNPENKKFGSQSSLAHQRFTCFAEGCIRSTATLLDSGQVLVAGGDEAPGGTSELFNPSDGGWSETGQMIEARGNHSATLLTNGRVLVTGGIGYPPKLTVLTDVELFYPTTGKWAAVAPMSTARTSHAAARLNDGRVLVTGGSTKSVAAINVAEIFDPVTGKWSEAPPMLQARVLHTATTLQNGAVLVTGGVDASGSVLRSTELFDPSALVWVDVGLMSHARLAHSAAILLDGRVLVAGGEHQSSAELYKASANGQACQVGAECGSGHCVDGVCCNDSCVGQCVTCALPGAEGNCSLAAPGTDPHKDCGAGGPCDNVCDSTGQCVDRIGEVCVAPSCSEDSTHAVDLAVCSQVGGACPQIVVDCAPYRCGQVDASGILGCRVECSSIDDCAGGYACDTDGKCRLRPDVAGVDPESCAFVTPRPSSPSLLWFGVVYAAFTVCRRRFRRDAHSLVQARRAAPRPSERAS